MKILYFDSHQYFGLRWYLIEIIHLLLETSLYVCLQKFQYVSKFSFQHHLKTFASPSFPNLWSQLKRQTHHIPSFLNIQNSKAFVDEKNRFSYIVTYFFKFYLLMDVCWSVLCCRFYDRTCTLRYILAQIEIFLAWHKSNLFIYSILKINTNATDI